ncbi:hypothetical protein [uncultured Aquimarina sp.]|uniref:hypothetical protein n=1 Tax=uncultured Aquimarina sp. TaxID=575652 RepID=UPI00260BFF8D|nr:hypothetical protein [uncultured Aquimarina sp.]
MNSNRLQCPSCGANDSFKENKPNLYTCSYCNSVFEHVSVIDYKNIEDVLYNQVITLLEESTLLTPDQPKYLVNFYAKMEQIHAYLSQLDKSSFYHKLFSRFEKVLDQEIVRLHDMGVSLDASKEFLFEEGNYMKFYSLINYQKMKALHLSKIHDKKDGLLETLKIAQLAKDIQDKFIGEYQEEIVRCILFLLQELKEKERLSLYLDVLCKQYKDNNTEMEQLDSDIYEIIGKEGYTEFKNRNN